MQTNEYHFRTVPKKEDKVAIRTIVSLSGVFSPDEIDGVEALIGERLARGIESGYYFVFAENRDVVVGFSCFGPIARTVGAYSLFQVAVRKDFQRKSVGTGLLSETGKHIGTMGGRRLFIETSSRAGLAPACLFFQKQGFILEASIRDYFDDGDDRLIFSKTLIPELM